MPAGSGSAQPGRPNSLGLALQSLVQLAVGPGDRQTQNRHRMAPVLGVEESAPLPEFSPGTATGVDWLAAGKAKWKYWLKGE